LSVVIVFVKGSRLKWAVEVLSRVCRLRLVLDFEVVKRVLLERHDLVGIQALVDHLVERLWLHEVLVVNVTRLRGVDANEVVLPTILHEGFSEHVPEFRIQLSDFVDDLLLLGFVEVVITLSIALDSFASSILLVWRS
jgi:hypothetical protein